MTKLLEEAFTLVSTQLNQDDQDELAHLMIEHVEELPVYLKEELEERQFEARAREAIKSGNAQHLLKKVATKYRSEHPVP